MLYYNSICENYDDFKSRYYDNCGRKRFRMNLQWAIFYGKMNHRDVCHVPDNDELLRKVLKHLCVNSCGSRWIDLSIGGMECLFRNDTYNSDHLKCVRVDGKDGLRLIRDEHIYGVKFGKMFNTINATIPEARRVPQHILNYAVELFAYKWRSEHVICEYELHVDEDFEAIYDTSVDMGSCMNGNGNWEFYRDAVDASACYLTDKDGEIVARAVRFNKVKDTKTGEVYRLLERQYSEHGRLDLKQMLVDKMVAAGEIDGYKVVGANYDDRRKFVSVGGEDWSDKRFKIDCTLERGDAISFQDSFAYYDEDAQQADNYGYGDYDLTMTGSGTTFDGGEIDYLKWQGGYYSWETASRRWVEDNCQWIEEKDAWCDEWAEIGYECYAKDSDYIRWSDHEGEYILADEAVYSEWADDYYRWEDTVQTMDGDYRLESDVTKITYGEHEGEYVGSDDIASIRIDGVWEDVWCDDDNLSTIWFNRSEYYLYVTDDGDIYFGDGFDEDNDALTLLGMAYAEGAWHTPERAQELLEEC